MATLIDIFAYERAVENAVREMLRTAGLRAFVEFDDEQKDPTPYVEIQLNSVTPYGLHRVLYQGATLRDAWEGTLTIRVVTARGKNSDKQYEMLGRSRIEMLLFRDRFTDGLLPYHHVDDLKETGLSRGNDSVNSLDWSELSYRIIFSVRPLAWPQADPV